MKPDLALWVFLGAAIPAGCGPIRPHAGFADVEKLVAERRAQQLHWNDGGPADRQVADTVTALLSKDLTPDAAVQVALLNNRRLQAVYQRLGVAQADLVQAGLLPNPVLNADVRFGVGVSGTGADVGLVQEFISVLQIPLRKRVAGAAFEEAKLQVAEAAIDLAAHVRTAFYKHQGALETLDLRRTVADATGLSADLATRQHEAGNNTNLEVATEQALFEQAKIDLTEGEAEVAADREELNALLGLWGAETVWRMSPRLPDLPADEIKPQGLETVAVQQRLDLQAARQRAEVLVQTRGLTRLYGLIPEGSAGAAAEREVEGGVWSLGPAIGLPIPIFDQRQAAIASYDAQTRQALENYAALAVEIRAEVRRARTRLLGSRSVAAYYRDVVVPLRHRIVEEMQRNYNGMLVGAFQLIQAKRDEIEAGRAYVAALTDYWTARAELERAVGAAIPLDGSSPSTPPTNEPAHHHGG
jgi:outer membrane protein, heavy metal efflux system